MSNQAKVGLFALITIVIFIFGFYFLKGTNLFTTKNKYYAVYERVDGLYKSNPVVVNGYRIGAVSNMAINPTSGKIVVEITAEDDFQIPDSSVATISSTDLVGSKVINVKLIPSPNMLKNGDTIQTKFKQDLTEVLGAAIDPLMAKLSKTLLNIDSVLNSISGILDKRNPHSTVAELDASLAHIRHLTASLDATVSSGTLDKSLKNIEGFTGNLKDNNQKINKLLSNFTDLSDSLKAANLKATINNARGTIDELRGTLDKINNGDGTLSKVINDKKLYEDIDSAVASLNLLLIDIKENPYRYVNVSLFGGKKRDDKYLAKKAKELQAGKK